MSASSIASLALPLKISASIAGLALAIGAPAAMAQTTPADDAGVVREEQIPPAVETPETGDDFHTPDDIVVTAPFVRSLDSLGKVSVIDGDVLMRDTRGQLGDTLARQPGVSATSFTPGASRPVLRGFQGERVRVLTDGIGAIDVSNTSADHAVTIDPLTAERIEILRGPAVLLFGGQAIGGAVNVLDRRIPRALPEAPAHIDALLHYGTAAADRSGGLSVDLPVGRRIALHVDAARGISRDVRTGGPVYAPALRAALLADAAAERAEGHADEADTLIREAGRTGRVPYTAARHWSAGAGASIVTDDSHLGVSVGFYDADYGVPVSPPIGHAHDEGDAATASTATASDASSSHEAVTIGLRQWRADLRGDIALGGNGPFERLRVRAGFADYTHTEFEGPEVGTRFLNQGIEGRVELTQRNRDGWSGASGFQYQVRDFDAVGAEAFLPANTLSQLGAFTMQEVALGRVTLTGAARWERTRARAIVSDVRRSFDALSGAVGASLRLADGGRVSLSAARTVRAPSPEELFSDGPHIATGAFERGNSAFGLERSTCLEAAVRFGPAASTHVSVTAWANRFRGFIYARDTGEEADGLPLFVYAQAPARMAGLEVEGMMQLGRAGPFTLTADGALDVIRASVRDDPSGWSPVPRIPPLRVRAGLSADDGVVDGRIELEWSDSQRRVASIETPTKGFALLSASIGWRPLRDDRLVLGIQATNILDVEARRHASFTKDFVPLAGRDVRLTARASF